MRGESYFNFLVCIFFFCFVHLATKTVATKQSSLLSENVYAKIFARRREDHKLLFKHLLHIEKYEKQYKMLEIAYEQIKKVIEESRKQLNAVKYETTHGFPKDQSTAEYVALIIENTCLFGDLLLHLPDLSYKMLSKRAKWREEVAWCLTFTRTYDNLFDESTKEMLSLFHQELSIEVRNANYRNPYSATDSFPYTPKLTKAKQKRKLKKGPTLFQGDKIEL